MGHNLEALFNPENIAVIGASNNPLKAGYTVIYNLNQIGYPKKVFPVTMSADEILGRKCYKKLSQIEDTVELVVLGTPAKMIYDIMDDLAARMEKRRDVKVVVCIAADYGETKTEEGIRRQECLIQTAKRYGIRVVGPNCIGIIDNINRVDTTFVETLIPKEMRGQKGGSGRNQFYLPERSNGGFHPDDGSVRPGADLHEQIHLYRKYGGCGLYRSAGVL